jgi:hypothetical protein
MSSSIQLIQEQIQTKVTDAEKQKEEVKRLTDAEAEPISTKICQQVKENLEKGKFTYDDIRRELEVNLYGYYTNSNSRDLEIVVSQKIKQKLSEVLENQYEVLVVYVSQDTRIPCMPSEPHALEIFCCMNLFCACIPCMVCTSVGAARAVFPQWDIVVRIHPKN